MKRKKEAGDADSKPEAANVTIGELFLTESCFAYATIAGELGWYVGCGTSKHMLNKKEWFRAMEAVLVDSKVTGSRQPNVSGERYSLYSLCKWRGEDDFKSF